MSLHNYTASFVCHTWHNWTANRPCERAKTHTYTKYMSLCVWVCVSVRVCVLNKYHNAI